MQEEALRAFVAKHFRIPDVPDEVWESLKEQERLVEHARTKGDEEREDLLRLAELSLSVYRRIRNAEAGRSSPPGRRKEEAVPVELRGREAERGHALSEALAPMRDEGAPDIKPLTSKVTMSWGKGPPLWNIILTAAPWVSAKEVERAYRDVQRKITGKDNRPLSPRSIAVFRFVEEMYRSAGKPENISWRKLLALYNERYPEDHELHFKDTNDPRNFQRTYERAYDEIMGCGFRYRFPKRELTPEEKQEARQALEKAEQIIALDKGRQKSLHKT